MILRAVACLLLLVPVMALAAVACGGEQAQPATVAAPTEAPIAQPTERPDATTGGTPRETPVPTSTATPVASTPTTAPTEPLAPPDPSPVPTATAVVQPANTPQPTAPPEDTPTPEPEPAPVESGAGPDSFLVGEGSQITFTVEEELNRAPVRFDAVIFGEGLTGYANLDGSPSVIELDLHSLESDQSFRDRYIRQRMFPRTPIATVTFDSLPDLPQSFFDGEETSGTLDGSLQIGETVTPLTFDVVARHDGAVINVLGKTTFTWDQLGLATPVAGPVVYLADEVRVQILIAAHAQ